jgi:NADH:ubiquinone oxidoreductase subunit D
MNREGRELLSELRRLNSHVMPLAMKIMDESVTVTAEEQYAFVDRLGDRWCGGRYSSPGAVSSRA